jgi:hypothetical protein
VLKRARGLGPRDLCSCTPRLRLFDPGQDPEQEPKHPKISYAPRPTIRKGLSRCTADTLNTFTEQSSLL